MTSPQQTNSDNELDFRIGKKEIIITQRYEFLNVLNDFIIAIWFLVGSFMFLSDKLVTDGTWLFIAGSAQMLIRPCISLAKLIHIQKIRNKIS